jgi:hypothetical protein
MLMPAKQLNFYATYNDVRKVLEEFEADEHVFYVLTGLFDIDTPQVFETYRAINSLSVSTDGDANRVPGYLIVRSPDHCDPKSTAKERGQQICDRSKSDSKLIVFSERRDVL